MVEAGSIGVFLLISSELRTKSLDLWYFALQGDQTFVAVWIFLSPVSLCFSIPVIGEYSYTTLLIDILGQRRTLCNEALVPKRPIISQAHYEYM